MNSIHVFLPFVPWVKWPAVQRPQRQGHRASGFETRERLGAGSLVGRSLGHPSGGTWRNRFSWWRWWDHCRWYDTWWYWCRRNTCIYMYWYLYHISIHIHTYIGNYIYTHVSSSIHISTSNTTQIWFMAYIYNMFMFVTCMQTLQYPPLLQDVTHTMKDPSSSTRILWLSICHHIDGHWSTRTLLWSYMIYTLYTDICKSSNHTFAVY